MSKICLSVIFLLYSAVLGKEMEPTNSECLTLSRKENAAFGQVSLDLESFVDANVRNSHLRLKKVLESFAGDNDSPYKTDTDVTVEEFILHQQIEMFEMLKVMKKDLDLIKNEIFPDASMDKYESSDSSKRPLEAQDNLNDTTFRPADCSEILIAGFNESAVYKIYPSGRSESRPVEVYCDMETDGGGWTVILSRVKVSNPISFYRNWNDYKEGFGTPGQEHWIGNQQLHDLTFHKNYQMLVNVEDGEGRSISGTWNTFRVDSEKNKYKLTVTHLEADHTVNDRGFTHANNIFFTTFDRDNDRHPGNCAELRRGGWWYNGCGWDNPTGVQGRRNEKGIRIYFWSKTDVTTRYATKYHLQIRKKPNT